jgi:uncharacterized protein
VEFSQQENNQNSVISIEQGKVQLIHAQLKTPCFISRNFFTETNIHTIKDISKISLFSLASQDDIDILIIGTGASPQFLAAKQQVDIQQMNIGTECMNSESACRSFNLLLSDIRNVGLLLL